MKKAAILLCVALTLASREAKEAGGPSFDCSRASTPVERAICADVGLSSLDAKMAKLLRQALAARKNERDSLLSSQRLWLAAREADCRTPTEGIAACLTRKYEERIAQLSALPSIDAAWGAGICRTFVELYRERVEPPPRCCDEQSFYVTSPLDAIAGTSRVKIEDFVAKFDSFSTRDLSNWAARQPRPFQLSKELMKALDQRENDYTTLDRLPGTGFFVLSSIQGTLHCRFNNYFEVKEGLARPARGPPNWEEELSACGVSQQFGTIVGTSVAYEDDLNYTPALASTFF